MNSTFCCSFFLVLLKSDLYEMEDEEEEDEEEEDGFSISLSFFGSN